MRAEVVLTPVAARRTAGGAAPRPPPPRPAGGGLRSTASPFTVSFESFIPSVISVTASARATLGANRFWSRRMTIVRIAESLWL